MLLCMLEIRVFIKRAAVMSCVRLSKPSKQPPLSCVLSLAFKLLNNSPGLLSAARRSRTREPSGGSALVLKDLALKNNGKF